MTFKNFLPSEVSAWYQLYARSRTSSTKITFLKIESIITIYHFRFWLGEFFFQSDVEKYIHSPKQSFFVGTKLEWRLFNNIAYLCEYTYCDILFSLRNCVRSCSKLVFQTFCSLFNFSWKLFLISSLIFLSFFQRIRDQLVMKVCSYICNSEWCFITFCKLLDVIVLCKARVFKSKVIFSVNFHVHPMLKLS